MKCCICGPVRNCGPYLDKVLSNMEKIGELFDDYVIILYYDISIDNTLEKLQNYQTKNSKLILHINQNKLLKYRTHRIALARNYCLDYIKNKLDANEYPYFIMMDCDNVNCKNVNPAVLKPYLNRSDWDGLSFNTTPKYYDIWGLSIYPYCFSYNHFVNSHIHNYNTLQDYITKKLKKLKKGELLKCISSFNGFSIYRTTKFLNTTYDGTVRKDLIPANYLKAHSYASKSPLVYKDFGHIKGSYEDCEHRAFHVQAINNDNAKIMITNDVLFS